MYYKVLACKNHDSPVFSSKEDFFNFLENEPSFYPVSYGSPLTILFFLDSKEYTLEYNSNCLSVKDSQKTNIVRFSYDGKYPIDEFILKNITLFKPEELSVSFSLRDSSVRDQAYWKGDWRVQNIRRDYDSLDQVTLSNIKERIAGTEGGVNIVDAGCGSGELIKMLAEIKGADLNLLGVDQVIKPGIESSQGTFLKGSLLELKCWEKIKQKMPTIDIMIFSGVLTECVLSKEDAKGVLSFASQSIKKDGCIFIYGHAPIHFTQEEMRGFGFDIIKSFEIIRDVDEVGEGELIPYYMLKKNS